MATRQVAKAYDDTGQFPRAWVFDDDGPLVNGTFVKFDRGQTRDFGPKVIAVLEVEGAKRSIWLTTAVLYGKFRDELQQRPGHRLEPGERITIKRLDKVESADAIGPYWKFGVIFHDAPELTVENLFGEFGQPVRQPPQTKTATSEQAEPGEKRPDEPPAFVDDEPPF